MPEEHDGIGALHQDLLSMLPFCGVAGVAQIIAAAQELQNLHKNYKTLQSSSFHRLLLPWWGEREYTADHDIPVLYFRTHAGKGATMDVTVAVLADYANVSRDGKLNIMGIFQEVNPPTLPYALPQMYLVLSFSAGPAEFGTTRNLRVALLHGDGQEILRLEAQMQVPSAIRPGSRAYINEAIGLAGVVFERPGDYGFSVLVGDDEKATVPLHVNEPLQQEVTND